MSFSVYLFKYNKRPNSLEVPLQSAGSMHSCYFREPTSVINPVMVLEDTKGEYIHRYNYAYIPNIGRYYFIDDIVSDGKVWVMYLRDDVLGSFRTSILNSYQYVIRSQSQCDPDIIDSMYLNKASSTLNNYKAEKISTPAYTYIEQYNTKTGQASNVTVSNYFRGDYSTGCFVLGILGDTANGVIYYAMDVTFFTLVLHGIFNLVPSNMSDVSSGIANALFNPIQYVTFCKWYSVMPVNRGSAVTSIIVGSQEFSVSQGTCYQLYGGINEYFKLTLNIPSHPDITSGVNNYLDLSPYRKLNLLTGLFGDIPLDTYKLYGQSTLNLYWEVDYTSGRTAMYILTGLFDWNRRDDDTYADTYSKVVYDGIFNVAVDIPVTALSYSWETGIALTGLSWLDDTVGDSLRSLFGVNQYAGGSDLHTSSSGNVHGGHGRSLDYDSKTDRPYYMNKPNNYESPIDKVIDAIGSSLGQVVSKGTSNSFSSYDQKPVIYAWFMRQVENNVERYGRPLYQLKQLSSLTGYCVCHKSHITAFSETSPPLETERNMIVNYLDTGVVIDVL